jgi:sterol desaturase/sphingolipid hydroxylase (fatty acid hydroxylase superfamily)
METLSAALVETGGWYPASEALLVGFTALVFLELGVDAVTGRPDRSWRETASNVMTSVPNTVISATAAAAVSAIGLTAFAQLAPWSLGLAGWTWALALVVADLCYYLGHRLDHRVRLLWAHHSVHHSSTDFDLSTSLRIAWHDGLITWVYAIPMAILGFHPGQIMVANLLVLVYQTWIHTQRIQRLPHWFEAVFNTPSHHRVHHGSNPRYLDANFGGVLIVWDRLFGTFVEEDEPVRYGITVPIDTINPIRVNFGAYLDLATQLRRARTLGEAAQVLLGPPEWRLPE